jgi:hypothetical protein
MRVQVPSIVPKQKIIMTITRREEVLKFLKKEILKSAKKGDFHYYWDVAGLEPSLINLVVLELEKEGKTIKSKGQLFKIIHW